MSWLLRVFTAPTPVLGFALARIALGAVLVLDVSWKLRDRALWLDRWRAPRAAGREREGSRNVALALAWMELVAACAFALGVLTLPAALVIAACGILLARQSPYVLYGGDAFATILVVLLALSPCDRVLGLSALASGHFAELDLVAPPFAGRLAQLEIVVLYALNVLVKLPESSWRRGTALSFVLRNPNFTRRWVPTALRGPRASKVITWGTLVLEGSFAAGLMFAPATRPLIVLAVLFHLGITLMMDVHLFGPTMMAALLTFVSGGWFDASASDTPLEASALVGAIACAAYAVAIVFFELLAPARLRDRFHAFFLRLGLNRRWHLFVGDPPCAAEVRIELLVVERDGTVSSGAWDPRLGFAPLPLRAIELPLRHRVERLKFSLARSETARVLFSTQLARAVRDAGPRVRAVSAAAVFLDVARSAEDLASAPLPSVKIATLVGRGKDGVTDLEAIGALGRETRASATLLGLVDLLLVAALDRRTSPAPRKRALELAADLSRRLSSARAFAPAWDDAPPFPEARAQHLGALARALEEDVDRALALDVVAELLRREQEPTIAHV
ncbi:MAG: hypothetical protein U0271_31545 [Polyangiaceae bacterium]